MSNDSFVPPPPPPSQGALQPPPMPASPTPPPLPNAPGMPEHPDSKLSDAWFGWLLSLFSPRAWATRLSWKVVAFLVAAPIVVCKIVLIPMLASSAANVIAEGYGVQMTVDDWSADLLNLSATAHEVTIFASGPYAEKELLNTEALQADLSLWSGLTGKGWVRAVTIEEPKIYLERLLTGRWNWEDLAGLGIAPPVSALGQAPGGGQGSGIVTAAQSSAASPGPATEDEERDLLDFQIKSLEATDMKLEWVENLPGNSGGGLIQDVKATLFVDDISLSISDLQGLVDLRTQPSRLSFEARTGDGKVSFDGRANLFQWRLALASAAQDGALSTGGSPEPVWMPAMEAKIYLENVGAGAFARLTPDAAILPQRGYMTGNVEFKMAEHEVSCVARLNLVDVTFAVNRLSPFATGRVDELESQLANYRVSGPREFACGGLLTAKNYRPFQAFQTNVVRKGVDQAPRTVQVAAAAEHAKYSNQPVEEKYRREVENWLESLDPETRKWLEIGAGAAGRRGAPGPRLPGGIPNPFGT